LKFKPDFKVTTAAKTSKVNGASLHVKIAYPTGGAQPGQETAYANIASVKVALPKQMPSRLTTLQKACTAAVFEANPARCPAASLVGTVEASTPVLKSALAGPAFLVSHGGAAFPDLVVVLQGEGITLELVGNTQIKNGITTSTFKTVPDAPVNSFELILPEGPHSVLATFIPLKAKGSMCGQHLVMPTHIVAQNGAVLDQSTVISVSGCRKYATKKRHRMGAKRGKHVRRK
jgi:hypothetical protein